MAGARKKTPSDVTRRFAKHLGEMRRRRGMSQWALAAKSGMHLSYLGRLERAACCPTIETVTAIALALDISAGDLLGTAKVETNLSSLREHAKKTVEHALQKADRPAIEAITIIAAALARG